jgi:hypothetical protein
MSQGVACCKFCGAQYRLVTIFKRDMDGLCKAWRKRHERSCEGRTPAERRAWAKKYAGKMQWESSITVDLSHPAFSDAKGSTSPLD